MYFKSLNKWRKENVRQPSFFRCLICNTKYNTQCTENFNLQQIDYNGVMWYYIITCFLSFVYSMIDMSWKDIQIFFNLYLKKNSPFFHFFFIFNFIQQMAVYLVAIILFGIISYQINDFFRYWKAIGPVYLLCIFLSSHLFFFKLINAVFNINNNIDFFLVCDMFMSTCNICFYFLFISCHNVYIEKSPTKVINFIEN